MLSASPASRASSRRARSTASRTSAGCSAATSAGARARPTLELADLVLSEAKVAFVPGEAFGAPGYARFSFALGDDDLVEGISRIAELVAATLTRQPTQLVGDLEPLYVRSARR